MTIEAEAHGLIASVHENSAPPADAHRGQVALPGMANMHSHAFQRAMAGLAEWRGGQERDTFWSWREVMYRFLDKLRPEDVQAIAAQLYVEMLEAGYTAVGEFHYVHGRTGGVLYDNLAELAERIVSAAQQSGIGLTLLPVLYQQGSFDGRALAGGQQRFYLGTDDFLTLTERCKQLVQSIAQGTVGIAPHSLRAVSPEALREVVAAHPHGPVHMHVAEQTKEVEDCTAWSGRRPAQWLLEHHAVDARWCFVHATHLSDDEVTQLARSGAAVALCPTTEGSLGDGTSRATDYVAAGGRWGIGSDSHIRIDVAEELRSLEYSQRLRERARNLLVLPHHANGRALYEAALSGGAQALAQPIGKLKAGARCDVVSLDANHPLLVGKTPEDMLNSFVFAGDGRCITDVWAAGRHVVQGGRHTAREHTQKAFAASMRYLMA